MSFEEEFDEGIRKKADELSYSFDEKNWEKARQLIDADRKANALARIGKALPSLLIVCVTITAAGLAAYNTLSGEIEPVLAQRANMKPASASTDGTAPMEGTVNTTVYARAKSLQTTAGETQQVKATVQGSEKSGSNTNSSNASNTNGQTTPLDPTHSALPVNVDKASTGGFSNNQQPLLAASLPQVPITPEADNDASPGVVAAVVVAEPASEQITADRLVSINALLTQPREIKEPVVSIQKTRSNDDYYDKHQRKLHYLNAEAGLAYMFGWNSTSGKDAQGVNWFAGVNYGLYLTRKFSLSGGVQLYSIAHINDPFYSGTSVAYGFGSTTTETMVTTNSLLYASLPLKLNYHVNKNSRIGMGVCAGYLVSATNLVQKYSLQDGGRTELLPPEKNKGIYNTLETKSILITASYATKLTSRLMLNAEAFYGLTDIFANTDYKNHQEKPVGIRLSIQYTLFDK